MDVFTLIQLTSSITVEMDTLVKVAILESASWGFGERYEYVRVSEGQYERVPFEQRQTLALVLSCENIWHEPTPTQSEPLNRSNSSFLLSHAQSLVRDLTAHCSLPTVVLGVV